MSGPPSWRELLARAQSQGGLGDPNPDARGERVLVSHPELASIEFESMAIAGTGGDVPARAYRPRGSATAALVWVHGGAFLAGDLDMAEAHWTSLYLASRGIAVLSLDYRKAVGGIHYPAPVMDVVAGWRWAVDRAGPFGVDPALVHLGGASAGAALACSVAKMVRDDGETTPRSLLLAYPVTHASVVPWDGGDADAQRRDLGALFFDADDFQLVLDNYRGPVAPRDDPYLFPANGRLAGLPPTLVVAAERDALRPGAESLADALAAERVSVRFEVVTGATHGVLSDPTAPIGQRVLTRMAEWILA